MPDQRAHSGCRLDERSPEPLWPGDLQGLLNRRRRAAVVTGIEVRGCLGEPGDNPNPGRDVEVESRSGVPGGRPAVEQRSVGAHSIGAGTRVVPRLPGSSPPRRSPRGRAAYRPSRGRYARRTHRGVAPASAASPSKSRRAWARYPCDRRILALTINSIGASSGSAFWPRLALAFAAHCRAGACSHRSK